MKYRLQLKSFSKAQPTPKDLLGPDQVEKTKLEVETSVANQPAPAPARPAVVKPISPERYKVELTASAELHDKLKRLQALMRSSVPDGDLATIIEEAVTEKLERLEAKRFGKTKAPRKSLEETDTSPSSRHIPAAVKRAVLARDGNRCSFVDKQGRRCTERSRLEFHHRQPFGRGGDHRPDNVYLVCHAHNRYLAEQDYGKAVMERYRRSRSRVSEPLPVYSAGADPRRVAYAIGW